MAEKVDLTEVLVPTFGGGSQVFAGRVFGQTDLGDFLIESFLPFGKCRKCPLFEMCSLAEWSVLDQERLPETQCGMAASLIRNLIDHAFDSLRALSVEEKQEFFRGLYYLARFADSSFKGLGNFIHKPSLEWWGTEAGLRLCGWTGSLRQDLDGAAKHFALCRLTQQRQVLLLVEGESEYAFIRGYHDRFGVQPFRVETYRGKGNLKNIKALIRQYSEIGYSVRIQGDADGGWAHGTESLVEQGLVDRRDVFIFSQDFESAVPRAHYLRAMVANGLIRECKCSQARRFLAGAAPVAEATRMVFGVDIGPEKAALAHTVGILYSYQIHWRGVSEGNDSELGAFLAFLEQR